MTRPIPLILAVALLVAGCGGSSTASKPASPNATEVSPSGDIPDNQAFVAYTPPSGDFTVKVPEGWSRSEKGGAVTFTDKLNSIRMETVKAGSGPASPGAAKTSTVTRTAGKAKRVTYVATGAADPVTGKARANAYERYEFTKGSRLAVLTLSGPKGADNVDPWKIVTDSFAWKR